MFPARLESAALLRGARIVAAAGIVRPLITLGRCVLGRRQIAAALRAPATSASTAPAKASTTTIAATVAAEILSAAAIIAVIDARTRVLLRWIELTKILRSGGVRLRLALLRFALRQAISFRLTSGVPFVTSRGVVMMFVREIRVQRLFVRDSLLRGIIRA
jgi:hypothetical protein